MRKFFIISLIGLIGLITIVFAQVVTKDLHYGCLLAAKAANHRIVVVMDPVGISGGKILLDESYVLNGSTSNIHVNISIGVE